MQAIKRLWSKLIKRDSVAEDHPPQSTEDSEELRMWDKLADNCCPDCSSLKTLGVVATGGLSLNIRCSNCDGLFWATCERAFGAKRLNDQPRSDRT